MKKLIAFMLAGIMLLCLSSCGKETNNPSDALNVVSGGSEQESANLKDILVEKTEQGVRLVFSFVWRKRGSHGAGTGHEGPAALYAFLNGYSVQT